MFAIDVFGCSDNEVPDLAKKLSTGALMIGAGVLTIPYSADYFTLVVNL